MPMLTEPVHVPGYVARAAVLLLILNTISSALPEADARPVSAPGIEACQEDEPCWDCSTMGNLICGPATSGEPTSTPAR